MKKTIFLSFLTVFSLCLYGNTLDFTHAEIVLPEKSPRRMKEAAQLLKSCMDKLSGNKTKIVTDRKSKGKKIILTVQESNKKHTKRVWHIRQQGNTVTLTGRSLSSLVFAVGDFLARSGYYVLTWDCHALPASRRLMVKKDLDITAKPAFDKVHIADSISLRLLQKKHIPEFLKYKRLNYLLPHPQDDDTWYNSYGGRNLVHNLYKYVPPEKYAKTHPEYYTLRNGVRTWQPSDHLCFSNEQLRKVLTENLLAEIASHRKMKGNPPTFYNISQNDNGYAFCECKNCKEIIKHYGGDTGLLLDFINKTAADVAKVYPDVRIGTEAYVNSEKALKSIKPASNVIIRYIDVYSRSDCRIPLNKQKERLRNLLEWAEICPGLAIWDYLNFPKSRSPETVVDALAEDLVLFKKAGVGNVLLEYTCRFDRLQNFIALHNFLAMQLLKDPSQDREKLICIYMKSYYGKASPEMQEFLTMLRQQQNKGLRTDDMVFLKKCSALLHKALVKAGNDSELKRRILQELNNVDFCLIRMQLLQGKTVKLLIPQILQYRKNLVYVLENNPLLNDDSKKKFLKDIQSEADMLSIDFELPQELKNRKLPKVLKLGLTNLYRVKSSGAELVNDPVSDMQISVTASFKGKIPHKLPFNIGYYDWIRKKGGKFHLNKIIPDGKYHWYKLGRLVVGPRSILYAHNSWGMNVDLRNIFTPDDGLIGTGKNPNIYECWVSLRFEGPAYTGKKARQSINKESGVWMDKLLLIPYEKGN